MKINWKIRFQNKAWLTTFIVAVLTLVYQVLEMCGVFPGVTQDTLTGILTMILDLFVMLGLVVDPTTDGLGDSERAMKYTKPGGNGDGE